MKFPGQSKETERGIVLRPGHVNKKINNYVFCTVQQPYPAIGQPDLL